MDFIKSSQHVLPFNQVFCLIFKRTENEAFDADVKEVQVHKRMVGPRFTESAIIVPEANIVNITSSKCRLQMDYER